MDIVEDSKRFNMLVGELKRISPLYPEVCYVECEGVFIATSSYITSYICI